MGSTSLISIPESSSQFPSWSSILPTGASMFSNTNFQGLDLADYGQ